MVTRREVREDTTEEVLIKQEREVIKQTEDCHNEEIQELCAPVNCKFVNLTKTCRETNKTVQVELREKQCVCETTATDTVCEEILTDTCDSEPLDKPWKKYCSEKLKMH